MVRDGGIPPLDLPEFEKKYNWSLAMYGQLPAEKAIADLIGAEFCYTQALELQLDEQYLHKMANKLLKENQDVQYIHLKGPDEPGHDHKPREKIKSIEKIDSFFFKELLQGLLPNDIVIVTCDHATPCELGIHSCDQVPLLICGAGISGDKTIKFSEKDALQGNCKITKAIDILPFIKNVLSNRDVCL